jgi:MFS family permease
MFSALRFLAGAGLASEFATSSVLISEIFSQKLSSRYTTWLYFCGILGGISATFLSILSWKMMFLFGGGAGFILYYMRRGLFESPLFLNLGKNTIKGNPWHIFKNRTNLLKTLKLALLIIPFYFTISIMFILPSFMPLKAPLSSLIHTLLIGFFAGNLGSTLISYYLVNKIKDFRHYFIINSLVFVSTLACFNLVGPEFFFIYAVILGLLGGGLPTIWIQVVTKSYGTNHRNTAANSLYVIGRGSSIGFNLLISAWLVNPKNFTTYCIITAIVIAVLSILVALSSKNMYTREINYLE